MYYTKKNQYIFKLKIYQKQNLDIYYMQYLLNILIYYKNFNLMNIFINKLKTNL